MKKRIGTLMLILCILLPILPVTIFAVSEFNGGDGTETTPYLISTAEQLCALAENVNGGISYEGTYFQLTNDIDLKGNEGNQWVPIGKFEGTHIGAEFEPFAGIFDGMGYTVSGLYINDANIRISLGLFGANVGTIQNLSVSGMVKGGNVTVASVVAENWGIVKNCYNAGTRLDSNVLIGGVVGRTEMGKEHWSLAPDSDSLVEGCCNKVPITIGEGEKDLIDVGGVVGSSTGIVRNCYNTADIFVSSRGTMIGGVICETGGFDTDRSLVENCYNTGSITIVCPEENRTYIVGGVVGMSNHTDYTDCYNSGPVIGESSVGGIVGISQSDTFKNCYNIGSVSGKYMGVGGIVGNGLKSVLINCYNTGSVTVDDDRAGGLIGDDSKGMLQNCYNSGSVSGNKDIGGLTGFGANSTLENCYNVGPVLGSEEFGSLIGSKFGNPLLKNCYYDNEIYPLEDADGTGMPTASFTGGEVTYLLQGSQKEQIWGQSLSADSIPLLTNETEKRVYQVTFVTKDTKSSVIYTNGKVKKPVDPESEKSDERFSFWSITEEEKAAEEFDFGSLISADTMLYAHWKTVSQPIPEQPGNGSSFYDDDDDDRPSKPSKTPTPAVTPAPTASPAPTVVAVADRFTDVKPTDWFADAVQYVCDRGMMNGMTKNAFSPNASTSRGMLVTILYRLEEEPSVSAAAFSDVASGKYYAKAVAWASQNGLVNGFGDGSFRPDEPVTREQVAAILYRYTVYRGGDVVAKADLSGFTDAAQISKYAREPLAWAKAKGFISGTDWGGIHPGGYATRAETAAILMRFCER